MADLDGTLFDLPLPGSGFNGATRDATFFGFPAPGDGELPVIDNFDPAVGTPLNRSDFVRFDVTDNTALRRVNLHVALGSDVFVVHDGDNFRGRFTNFSSRAAIAGGFRYSVKPNGGWTSAPTFTVSAIDTSGNEAI